MIEIHLTGENFSSSVLPSLDTLDTNEEIHVILSANGTLKIISTLWTSIFTDNRLRRLSLIDLQLYQSDSKILADYLRQQVYLVELILDSVRQSVYSFDLILNEGLQNNKSIKNLTLSNLENVDAATIASLIQHNNVIEYLSLTHDNISPDGGALIADALRTNSTLISLDLSYNRINKQGAIEFDNIRRQPHPSLKYINIDNNDIIDKVEPEPEPNLPPEIEPMIIVEPPIEPKNKFSFLPIILVTFLFFLWGVPNQLNDVLIRQFSKTFTLSRFEAGLVQSAFYMGYFTWALPAAYVLRRWGYKIGLIIGLVLFGTGSFLFWPAAIVGKYIPFLISLFIIATGLAFLETAANPFIANAAGPNETSEKRLNIAQAFNPLGAITGVLIGTLFIFSGIELDEKEIEKMRLDKTYDNYLKQETLRVVQPYVILGGVAYLWALFIAFVTFPDSIKTTKNKENNESKGENTLCRPLFLFSIIAQFAYVGAQVGTWSYFIQYAQDYVEVGEKTGGYFLTGTLVMFALGRFTAGFLMHYGFSPSILLAIFAFINVLLIVISVLVTNSVGLGALFFTSFFMSLMFPTIFALGIKGMSGQTTKLASCLIVMAIIGGAVITPLMGLISVKTKSLALAYILPGGAYLIVALYALLAYVLTTERSITS
jgi:FHS family L-fucose permease-like MFS transporter